MDAADILAAPAVETEWAVRWPEDYVDGAVEPESMEECSDEAHARLLVARHPEWHGVVVSCTVTRSPWEAS
jgi:hypothetical protein